jgi:hypothetical protein
MSANTPGPAAAAGYTDATFPDEIYFPRLRSTGMNTVVDNFMRIAYAHPNNIACHMYAYMKTTARPLTEFRFVVSKTDTTDYWLVAYLRALGNDMYRIHMGEEIPNRTSPVIPEPPIDRLKASEVYRFPWQMFRAAMGDK